MENEPQPIFSHVEPVFAVGNINETVMYWHNVLGFPVKWTWGEPPVHGGVSWQKVFIQFSHNPQLATLSKGNSVWIRVQHIESLYNFHQNKNAQIVAPLEHQPYGMFAYTLEDINGYYVHFAGNIEEHKKSSLLPSTVRIIGRVPAIKEYQQLEASVNNKILSDALTEKLLSAAIRGVVAEDTSSGEVIGCALLLGDDATFYYVKDVMVKTDWQGKRIGSAMMNELNRWLDANGAKNALVALIARETLEPFYQQFGFSQAFSMLRYINRDEDEKQ
jgi:GNAT superfamily N-acetyltransferase/uncharacterized glyoxalase superfamily protein PhnB